MKKIGIRQYAIGALIGAALMFGIQAGASGLLTGSKVAGEKTVTYNGETIGQAAIINDTSYLPVRAVSNEMGLNINLNGGAINLTSPESVTSTTYSEPPTGTGDQQPEPTNPPPVIPDDLENQYAQVNGTIYYLTESINTWQKQIDYFQQNNRTNDPQYAQMQKTVSDLKSQLQAAEQKKSELEAQLNGQ